MNMYDRALVVAGMVAVLLIALGTFSSLIVELRKRWLPSGGEVWRVSYGVKLGASFLIRRLTAGSSV